MLPDGYYWLDSAGGAGLIHGLRPGASMTRPPAVIGAIKAAYIRHAREHLGLGEEPSENPDPE